MGLVGSEGVALLTAMPHIMARAANVHDALQALADSLRPTIPSLWRASVRTVLPEQQQLEIVAVWCAVETQLVPGVRMSLLATSFPEVSKLDRSVLSSERRGDSLLVEQVLASEGVSSWVSIPLHRDGTIVGLLGLSSLDADAFDSSDLGFFDRLGRRVEGTFTELMV